MSECKNSICECDCKHHKEYSPRCPKCNAVLTPMKCWKSFVCDCCGYGKSSYKEMDELQQIIKNLWNTQITRIS